MDISYFMYGLEKLIKLVLLDLCQIYETGSSSGQNARIELQLKNCTTTWILHWGYLYRGDM